MDWHQIKGRVAAGEDVRTEFKRSLEFRQVGKAICGFANTAGGVLILGVDDAGDVVGIRGDVESVRERLTSFLQNGCNVPVRATCGHRATASGHVHWIEVPRQRGFEPMRQDGRVWVRRDRSTVEPSPTELQSLYNAFGYVLTEEQTILAAGPNDIDMDAFRGHLTRQGFDVAREPQPAVEDDLRNRGVLAEFDGRLHPTLYGLLSFGKHPQGYPHTGNFWVDCVAYAGNDQAAEIILAGEGQGPRGRASGTRPWLDAQLGAFREVRGSGARGHPLLPPTALREALVNAVVHRDYAISGSKVLLEVFHDRVQITSPGTLPNHLSVAAVCAGGRTRSRNEQLANFMLERRFMEQRGRGWLVMRRAMQEFNGTVPTLVHDEESRFVTVILRLAQP